MRLKTVPSAWLQRDGRRLDSGPYTSGALEARIRLEELSVHKEPLRRLTAGHEGGIYNGPHFSRTWVDDPAHGVPFLGSSDMLMADLSKLPLLRKRDAHSPKLSHLRIQAGMTLISCSGTIGRMVFARPDMDEIWSSQDIIKVVPDPARVPPGYLYAFLSSKFGVPIVTSATYGAIIPHIEPQHIAKLPVPRLGEVVEQQVDRLVAEAARLRVEASSLLRKAIALTLNRWGVIDLAVQIHDHPDLLTLPVSQLRKTLRLDAFHYGRGATASDRLLADLARRVSVKQLGDRDVTAEVFETTRFGRQTVDDPRHGVRFLSISDLVRFDPKTDALVSKRQIRQVRAEVRAGWLVLPRVGQLQGVFGTVCYIPGHLDGVGVSDNNIRIVPNDEEDGAYLWAAMSTRIIYYQITRRASGGSIPFLDSKRVATIPVPWPRRGDRAAIGRLVIQAMQNRSTACGNEDLARATIEKDIKAAS